MLCHEDENKYVGLQLYSCKDGKMYEIPMGMHVYFTFIMHLQ